MQGPEVAAIFAAEKNRMGAIIGFVDRELYKTPRWVMIGNKLTGQEYAPWQGQGLEDKRDEYCGVVNVHVTR
jgi:hypothetical protein